MKTSVELRGERATLFSRMKELVERADAENAGVMSAEESAEFDKLHAEQEDLGKRVQRAEQLENSPLVKEPLDGPKAGGRIDLPDVADGRGWLVRAYHQAGLDDAGYERLFRSYMRHGTTAMASADLALLNQVHIGAAALQTTSGAAGGYGIPPAWQAQIFEALKWFGGMRQVANIISTSEGQDLPFITVDDTGNVGEILGEGNTASEQAPTFGQRILKAHVFSSKVVPVSITLLNDEGFGLVPYLTRMFGQRIGRVQNTYFTTGAGANEPSGIVSDATLGVTTAGTATFTYDEIAIDLVHSVDIAYRNMPTAGFMLHDTSLKALKKLKNGDGDYLWTAGTQSGEPDRLAGYRYTINNDMATPATTAKSVLFGDLHEYYIRDVEDISVMRFEDSVYGLKRQIAMVAFARADGGLIDAGQHPVKYLQHA
jgi:HK97 family phage major capsid protein